MQWLQRSVILGGLVWGVLGLSSTAHAVEGMKLVKAGFTVTTAKEEFQKQARTDITEIQLESVQNKEIFFWTEIQCDPACQRLNQEKILIVHRWVRDYGVNVMTTQAKEFTLKELLDNGNVLQSTQGEVKAAGAWFVEVRSGTVDGPKLCLPPTKKNEPELCKFLLRVK